MESDAYREILRLRMTSENVALVRRTYEVINAIGRTGDEFVDPEELAPDLWARLAPDFELHGRTDVPDAQVYRGREAAKEFWRMLQEVWAEVRWEPLAITDLDRAVVVDTRIVAYGRGSDVPIEAAETDVFWFRDGAIVRLQGFPSRDEALEAAGFPAE
jgi:ketosteroid isomerase-like protein